MNKINKDTFCYLPFGSVYVEPTGRIHPCCIAHPFEESINWKDFKSVDELVNSAPYKRIRKQLINGEKPIECEQCFVHKNLHREGSNKEFAHFIEEEELYNEDYSVNKVTYVDLRLSNLCNFACRMCFHGLSSTWYEFWGYIQGKPEYINENTKFLVADNEGIGKFSEKNIDSIKKVYLAGGEPFIAPHTFELLERFTDEQASTVDILINTNLSTLTYKGESILNKLIRFKNIRIACSCDGFGEIGEYQRPGFNSDRFFKNLKTLVEFGSEHPNFYVEIDYTVSSINVFHTFDFIEYLGENYIDRNRIRLHAVVYPIYLSPSFFTDETVNSIIKLYRNKLEYYKNTDCDNLAASIGIFIKYLEDSFSEDARNQMEKIHRCMDLSIPETIRRFDEVHNTDYRTVCPWLQEIIDRKKNTI